MLTQLPEASIARLKAFNASSWSAPAWNTSRGDKGRRCVGGRVQRGTQRSIPK